MTYTTWKYAGHNSWSFKETDDLDEAKRYATNNNCRDVTGPNGFHWINPAYREDCERCTTCKLPLLYETEFNYGKCENCLDREAELAQTRREFDYYHP